VGEADRFAELKMDADHTRRRVQLYRARAYGLKPVSAMRLRELERLADAAEARLNAATTKQP
jgi:hypothetical protein